MYLTEKLEICAVALHGRMEVFMEMLKKLFPLSFKEKSEIGGLILNILLYLAGAIVAGFVIGILSGVPVWSWIFGLIGTLAELYVVTGIVLSILDYLKILK